MAWHHNTHDIHYIFLLFQNKKNYSIKYIYKEKSFELTDSPLSSSFSYETDVGAFKKKVKEHIADINNKLYEDIDTDDPHALR